MLGTIIASLYRTNDMILYAYKYLLHDKPWKTYKRWISCLGLFLIVVLIADIDNPIFSTYPRIIAGTVIVGICSLIGYTLLQIIFNPKEFKMLYFMLQNYLKGK